MKRRSKAQNAIERIHQRAMNLRDSLPVGDPDVAEQRENVYRRAYFKAWRTNDLKLFKIAARHYRKGLRDAAEAEEQTQHLLAGQERKAHALLVALKAAEGLSEQCLNAFGENGLWPELHAQAKMTSAWVRTALATL